MTADDRSSVTTGDADAFYAALLDDDAEDLYDAAPCAYLSTLPDGTIAKVNRTFLAWTGHDRAALVGRRRLQELLAPGDRIFYETHVAPMLRMQGQVREIAVELVCQDGQRLPAVLSSALKQGPDGEPLVVRTAIFDATERRAYERELIAARRRAEAAEARATELARTLQASFLPPALPDVPGLDLGGAYRPSGDGSVVGGDFYDVFENGRAGWGVVLGDVSGKGPEAAVVTSLARHTVRSEALRTPYPSAVLAELHEAVSREHLDRFCTALFAVITPGRSSLRFAVASGGHQLPLRRRADGRMDEVGESGGLLGALGTPRLTDTTVELVPGDLVVMCTDGVTEARRDGVFFDEQGLREVVDAVAEQPAQAIADAIVRAALDFQRGEARDDIAVLVLKPS